MTTQETLRPARTAADVLGQRGAHERAEEIDALVEAMIADASIRPDAARLL